MHTVLNNLDEEVAGLDLLGQVATSESGWDDMLDSRDGPDFDGEWTRVYKAVQQAEEGHEPGTDDKELIDRI
jgi:hypothetical protein